MKSFTINIAILLVLLLALTNITNAQWTQIGNDIDAEAAGDKSGKSVSLSSNGTVLAIGAIENDGNGFDVGHVRIYEFDRGNWVQLGSDIDGETANYWSGWSVNLNSDGYVVAIGALGNNGNDTTDTERGHVRIYEYSSGNWVQLGNDIDGKAADDESGRSVSLSSNGTIVAIGASGNFSNGDSGHARVYEYIGCKNKKP